MKIFVTTIIIVLFFVLFAVDNTTIVPLKLVTLSFGIPLSLAIIVPLGLGLLFFALFHLGRQARTDLVIRDLEDNVESAQKQVLDITKRTHQLEIENRKLKIRLGDNPDIDDESL
jgi:uncharacterized integral membrane protein